MSAENRTSKERAALQGLVAAWNALGVGEHPPKVIGRWLMEHMKPAIDQIRDVLQQPDEPSAGQFCSRCGGSDPACRICGEDPAIVGYPSRPSEPPAAEPSEVVTINEPSVPSVQPVARVINNNQPGWTNIVETAPNVTLEVGAPLYDRTAIMKLAAALAGAMHRPSEPPEAMQYREWVEPQLVRLGHEMKLADELMEHMEVMLRCADPLCTECRERAAELLSRKREECTSVTKTESKP